MDIARAVVLILATLTVGGVAGIVGLYANTLMPGLGRTDDRTFVGAFQAIDTRIINPLFLGTFFGGLVFSGLAALLHLDSEYRSGLPWIVAAFVLYLGVIVVTVAVNVPLNDGIKAAGSPDRITDLAAVRAEFNEARWTRWNTVRVVLTTVAFACLAWSLVLLGRSGLWAPTQLCARTNGISALPPQHLRLIHRHEMSSAQPIPSSVPPMIVPAHNLARWVRTELSVANASMVWDMPRTILGIVPLWRRRVVVPAADVDRLQLGRAIRVPSLLVGAALVTLPLVLGWGWWALATVPIGIWIGLVALGPRLVAVSSSGAKYRANVCFGHQFDAELYVAAVEDIARDARDRRRTSLASSSS